MNSTVHPGGFFSREGLASPVTNLKESSAEEAAEPENGAILPQTSLIVCSRNRPGMLVDVVRDLLAGKVLPTELIIVDQSDTANADLTSLSGDQCQTSYHWMRTKGLSRALNFGISLARHPVLVFTHDDVAIPPDWFGTIVRSLVAIEGKGIVTGRVLPEAAGGRGGYVPSTKTDEEPAVFEGRVDAGVLYPMNMAMHRSAIEEVGPFDERLGPGTPFPAAEDNDLSFRLLEAGYRIFYVPAAVLYHRAWRSDEEYFTLRWGYGRGQGAFYAKHMSVRDRHQMRRLAWEVQHRSRRLIRNAYHQPRRSAGELVYFAGLLSGLAQWLLTNSRRA